MKKKEADAGHASSNLGSDFSIPIPPKSVIGRSKLSKSRSKPNSKPSSPSPRTPAKRSLDLDPESSSKKSFQKKNKGEKTVAAEEGKKFARFQRLCSNDDEIVLLGRDAQK